MGKKKVQEIKNKHEEEINHEHKQLFSQIIELENKLSKKGLELKCKTSIDQLESKELDKVKLNLKRKKIKVEQLEKANKLRKSLTKEKIYWEKQNLFLEMKISKDEALLNQENINSSMLEKENINSNLPMVDQAEIQKFEEEILKLQEKEKKYMDEMENKKQKLEEAYDRLKKKNQE